MLKCLCIYCTFLSSAAWWRLEETMASSGLIYTLAHRVLRGDVGVGNDFCCLFHFLLTQALYGLIYFLPYYLYRSFMHAGKSAFQLHCAAIYCTGYQSCTSKDGCQCGHLSIYMRTPEWLSGFWWPLTHDDSLAQVKDHLLCFGDI